MATIAGESTDNPESGTKQENLIPVNDEPLGGQVMNMDRYHKKRDGASDAMFSLIKKCGNSHDNGAIWIANCAGDAGDVTAK